MAIKQSKKTCYFAINLLIFSGLLYLCYTMKPVTKEGISNMNCCGGIEAGVHYKETDRNPPDYVKRCFKSSNQNGQTVYEWNGFPCTHNGSSDCCNNEGECIATSQGGYCKATSGADFYYMRRSNQKSSYTNTTNDKIIDINDARDMQDYFYERRTDARTRDMSPEMQQFLNRRSDNERFVQDTIVSRAENKEKIRQDAISKNIETAKNNQIIYIITLLHIGLLLTILFVIRRKIIAKIQGYLDVVVGEYDLFAGKGSPELPN